MLYRPIQVRDAQHQIIPLTDDDLNMMVSRAGTSNIKYKAESRPGTELTEAGWKIKKYTYDSTNVVVRTRTATTNSLADYNNIWDNSVAVVISSITKAALAVVTTATAHGYSTGDKIEITDSDMTEANGDGYGSTIFSVVKIDSTSFSLKDVDGTAVNSSAYASAGTTGNVNARNYLNLNYQ